MLVKLDEAVQTSVHCLQQWMCVLQMSHFFPTWEACSRRVCKWSFWFNTNINAFDANTTPFIAQLMVLLRIAEVRSHQDYKHGGGPVFAYVSSLISQHIFIFCWKNDFIIKRFVLHSKCVCAISSLLLVFKDMVICNGWVVPETIAWFRLLVSYMLKLTFVKLIRLDVQVYVVGQLAYVFAVSQ